MTRVPMLRDNKATPTYTLMRTLHPFDFHHTSTLWRAIHLDVYNGSITFILKRCSFEKKKLHVIQIYKINFLLTFPWVIAALAREPIFEEYDIFL
jgi:acyl-coenzyme A synthetase/AMP-(fatty) acid ligase